MKPQDVELYDSEIIAKGIEGKTRPSIGRGIMRTIYFLLLVAFGFFEVYGIYHFLFHR